MRLLIIAMQYPTAPGQSYLTTELADALADAGHEVEVLHLDWTADRRSPIEEITTRKGVRVVRCPAMSFLGLRGVAHDATKFLFSGLRAARVARRFFDLKQFEAAITWMPALAIAPLVRDLERAAIPHRLLFIWDFFPDHHHAIGRIPGGWPLRIARALEQRLMERFTAIICTLPGNIDYLRRTFRIRPEQRVLACPVWGDISPVVRGDRANIRRRYSLPTDAPIAIFGGQLVEGRGFEQMLAAADAARIAGSRLTFLFVGEGRFASAIRSRSATQGNIAYRPSLTRRDYLQLLGACDVGMIATVPGVGSFSLPSKTIDYLRAALPIVAALEDGNDFIEIIEEYGIGASVPLGDGAQFYAEAERLARSGSIRNAAARCLGQVFDVRQALAIVERAARPLGRTVA